MKFFFGEPQHFLSSTTLVWNEVFEGKARGLHVYGKTREREWCDYVFQQDEYLVYLNRLMKFLVFLNSKARLPERGPSRIGTLSHRKKNFPIGGCCSLMKAPYI